MRRVRCLVGNLDVFAWSPNDIPEISPKITQHHLRVLPGAKPVKQKKKRNLAPERQVTIKEKIEKLLHAGFYSGGSLPRMARKHCACEKVK